MKKKSFQFIIVFLGIILTFLVFHPKKSFAAATVGDINEYAVPTFSDWVCPSPRVALGLKFTIPFQVWIRCGKLYGNGIEATRSSIRADGASGSGTGNYSCNSNEFLVGISDTLHNKYTNCASFSVSGTAITWSGNYRSDVYSGNPSGVSCGTRPGSIPGVGLFTDIPGGIVGAFLCESSMSYSPPAMPSPGSFNLYSSSACSGTTNQTNILSWSASSNASYYYVYRDGSYVATRYPGSESYSETLTTSTHSYSVRAYNASGSRLSSPSSISISALDCAAPGSFTLNPINSTCTQDNKSVNKLSWTTSSGATNYYVYRCEQSSGGGGGGHSHGGGGSGSYSSCKQIASLGSGARSYDDEGITYPNTYEYYVRAYKSSNGTNSYSSRQRIDSACCILPQVDLKINGQDSSTVKKAEKTTMTWTTQDALSLSINPGISCDLTVPNGSCDIYPLETTNYRLTAYGICAGKSSFDDVKIMVDQVVYKGIFIANNIIIHTDRDNVLKIQYDPRIIKYPPPGFAEILPPIYYQEVAP